MRNPKGPHLTSKIVVSSLTSFAVVVSLCGAERFPREGFTNAGGSGIGKLDGKDFSITHLIRYNLHRFILWSSIQTTDGYLSKMKELAMFDILVEDTSQYFVFGEGMCKRNGVFDPEIICLVRPSSDEFQPAVKAWRINRRLKRFEPISPKGVEGKNEGYGA
ncbi:hypothetical protein [Geothrix alkalitolerans]|uniref:hypothetical protein n=1 Tax=Geothrix alkalitolerans TaxID=2922724 RepID=UPI001FAE783B|nr:hypothetical protein [Geothrix alkalitolerans]